MEMTLRLPQNYVEIEEEEMMYLDGGGKLVINRKSVSNFIGWIGAGMTVGALAGKIISVGKVLVSYTIAGSALSGLALFLGTGILIASATTVAIALLRNKTITLNF